MFDWIPWKLLGAIFIFGLTWGLVVWHIAGRPVPNDDGRKLWGSWDDTLEDRGSLRPPREIEYRFTVKRPEHGPPVYELDWVHCLEAFVVALIAGLGMYMFLSGQLGF